MAVVNGRGRKLHPFKNRARANRLPRCLHVVSLRIVWKEQLELGWVYRTYVRGTDCLSSGALYTSRRALGEFGHE